MLISLSLLLVIGAFPVVKAQNTSTALVDNGQFEEVVPRNGQWTKEAPKNRHEKGDTRRKLDQGGSKARNKPNYKSRSNKRNR